jgi:glycosyltransferase involved in cell wall biosynthesis
MPAPPMISIVMPSLNQGPFIREAIESILSQSHTRKELIVIDGGSTDATLDILREFEGKLAYWSSEPDGGQAEAIVKGMRRARGDIVNWINSDDLLIDGALARIAEAFADADAVAAPVIDFAPDGRETLRASRGLSARGLIDMHRGTRYQQPGIWLRRAALQPHLEEWLPADHRYAFDFALYVNYFHRHPHVVYLQDPVARFRLHADSKTVKEKSNFESDYVTVIERLVRDPDFKSLLPSCRQRLNKLSFRIRLRELEETGTAASLRSLTALVRLHPASILKGQNFVRLLKLRQLPN